MFFMRRQVGRRSRSIASTRLSTNAHWLQTHNHLRLVMVVAHRCTRQSQAPNIDCCVPEMWPWPLTLTQPLTLTPTLTLRQCNSDVKIRLWAFDLDLWPTTLTYNPNLAKVKVNLHTEYQCRRSNGSGVRALTDGQTDGRTLPSALSPCFTVDIRSFDPTGHK